ncbi:MAG: PQQ-binding-like beta-propeller repeat protein [Acidobacteria bacterium]|nr:PQQ-binding-like beta-propeller repeat protein [Acidobacteriota bacterium]
MRVNRAILLLLAASTIAAAHWRQWRGPNANGTVPGDAPLEWSDSKNIAWKASIPGRGFSSPVVSGDKVFLTTAVLTRTLPKQETASSELPAEQRPGWGGGAGTGAEYEFQVIAIDRRTGKTAWQRTATTAVPHEGHHQRYGSFASNSPVTDGAHLYAFFGSRGVYCYDMDGNLEWEKAFPPMSMAFHFGEGTAAVLHDRFLLLNFDQEKDSHLLALDKNTGEEIWRVRRDEPTSWAPPLVVEHDGRKQVIVSASRRVRAYDLNSGAPIWECAGLGTNVIPAPVAANGVVYVMSGFQQDPNLLAIKLGGAGDLTGTESVLWSNRRGNSYTPSPVLAEGKLYFLTDSGRISCLDAATGAPYYQQQRLGAAPYNLKASPVAVNGKLYVATEEGDTVVVKMGEKLEVLAVNTLTDQSFVASPAVADGDLYLRSQNTLFCIRGE